MSPIAGPSKLLSISGSTPGLLDPSQPARLLRFTNSKLSFAAFDPRTASAVNDASNLRNLSVNEQLYRPKRVVVETTPAGESFWRFVPKARFEEGAQDEGTWPRVIEICGTLVECSQDQWDLYKLDPVYDCFVRIPPNLTTILPIVSMPTNQSETTPQTSGKRSLMTPSPDQFPPTTRKKPQRATSFSSSSSSEMEIEDIIVDDRPPRGERARKIREEFNKNRKTRRGKINAKYGRVEDEMIFDFFEAAPSTPRTSFRNVPPASTIKRKASSLSGYLGSQESSQYAGDDETGKSSNSHSHKRTRTVSPESVRRELVGKRTERKQQKTGKWHQKLDDRRHHRDRVFMEEILRDVRESGTQTTEADEPIDDGKESKERDREDQEDQEDLGVDEAARQAAIAESRRKLAELEADRPLWEEHARKRAMREREEEEARRAKAEERRQAAKRAEEEKKTRAEEEKREKMRREEDLRREREDLRRRDLAKRQRQQLWELGPWTVQRALERYRRLSDSFDGAKFSLNEPLSFEAVPWPVLHSPVSFTVEDVDWCAVEKFFEAVKPYMQTEDFKLFVQTSHRRFHPDRWRARGLLKSIADDTERGCLEVAANSVAQALTPLWRELTGK